MKITLYHNPSCTKSKQTLSLLQEKGVAVSVIEYLKVPLTVAELKVIAQKLDLEPRQFMRSQEPEYQRENLENNELTEQHLLEAIVKYPKLLERPIAMTEHRAVIGRPPENVLALL